MKLKYKAMVLSCMDPRFQLPVFKFIKKKNLVSKYSSFTIAGASVGVTHSKFKKWHQAFLDNLKTSIKLHKIKKLIVVNHEDCGAIKIAEGNNGFDEFKVHKSSFKKLKATISKRFPKLKIEFYVMKLNKKTSKVSIN